VRERARLSTRGRRTRDDHEDQPAAPASKIAPGRLRATDVADWPELDLTAVAPGRLTNEDVGRHMDPAEGLAYAQSLL